MYIYPYISSLLHLPPSYPPYITLLAGHKAPSWSPCAMRQLPTSYLFYVCLKTFVLGTRNMEYCRTSGEKLCLQGMVLGEESHLLDPSGDRKLLKVSLGKDLNFSCNKLMYFIANLNPHTYLFSLSLLSQQFNNWLVGSFASALCWGKIDGFNSFSALVAMNCTPKLSIHELSSDPRETGSEQVYQRYTKDNAFLFLTYFTLYDRL